MLEPLGVAKTAEDLYCALLRHGPGSEARLADLLGVEPDEAVKALDELRELGLVSAADGPAGCWRAEPPEVTLASLVVRQQESLLKRQRELDRALSAVGELVRLSRAHGPGHAAGVVELATDATVARQRSAHLARMAERCVMTLDKLPCGGGDAGRVDPSAGTGQLAMVERGVEFQAIYERAALLVPGRFDELRRLAAGGEQARTLPDLPMTLVVYDRTEAVVHLDDGEVAGTPALFVHQSPLLAGLVGLFELLWERAVPIPPSPEEEPPVAGGSDVDDALIALLAAGFKDESIARHLGISPSTVTRRMARLMEISGASTRFQLGMQAARRGWI